MAVLQPMGQLRGDQGTQDGRNCEGKGHRPVDGEAGRVGAEACR